MHDNLDPSEYRNPSAPKGDMPARPITDREVPLTGQQTPTAIHSWLDGELSESAVRQSDASRDVDFWLRSRGAGAPSDADARAPLRADHGSAAHSRTGGGRAVYNRSFTLTPAVA